MKLQATPNFIRKLRKLTHKNSLLTKKINQQLKLLVNNARHPSLRLHKLDGKQQQWSLSVQSDLRIIFRYTSTGILLTDIGTHDQVY